MYTFREQMFEIGRPGEIDFYERFDGLQVVYCTKMIQGKLKNLYTVRS